MFGLKRKLATQRIEVRTARPDDLGAILAIEHGSGLADQWNEKYLVSAMSSDLASVRVASLSGGIVGWACGGPRWNDAGFEITDLVVLPEYRRRGVGGHLYVAMVYAAFDGLTLFEARRRVMCATLPETNVGGLLFLSACGMAFPTVLRDSLDPGVDTIRMSWRPPADDLGCTGWVEGVA